MVATPNPPTVLARVRPGAVAALLGAVLALCATAAALASADPGAPEKRPFRHRSHVADVWYNRGAKFRGQPTDNVPASDRAEVARDCRGCHDFGRKGPDGKAGPPHSPMEVCTDCHVEGVMRIEIVPGYEKGLRAGRGSTSAFEHLDHDALACRECHSSKTDDELDDLPGKTGVPACVECHTKGGEDRAYDTLYGRTIDRTKLRTGFAAWLNADPSMTRDGRGPYPHDEHLSPQKLADKAACQTCHADVDDASADDLHLKEYTAEKCADCHVQAGNEPVRVDRAIDRRPSVAAQTFAHGQHLGSRDADPDAVSPGARAQIDAEGCLACHVHSLGPVRAPDGSALPPTFVLRDDRDDYAGCMTCHDVPRFRATNHGQWEKCTGCHSFGEGDPKTTRPRVAVERAVAGKVAFLLDAQSHPGIAGKPSENCVECHRASLPGFPSRIAGRRFEHASHLGREPRTEDCRVCHASVAQSDGSTEIGAPWDEARADALPAERRLTFEMSACSTCHPGIRLDPNSLVERTRREVVAFSHADHLGKSRDPRTGQPVSCASCHDFDPAARGRDLGVNAQALTCVQCHQHDEQHAAWTGGIFGKAVESCDQCHSRGVPRIDSSIDVDRVRVALRGPQHHPEGRRCFDCHVEEAPGRLDPVTAVAAMFPRLAPGVKELEARSPHRSAVGKPFVRSNEVCSDCHWAIETNATSTNEGRELKASLTSERREKDGNQFRTFPGGQDRGR